MLAGGQGGARRCASKAEKERSECDAMERQQFRRPLKSALTSEGSLCNSIPGSVPSFAPPLPCRVEAKMDLEAEIRSSESTSLSSTERRNVCCKT